MDRLILHDAFTKQGAEAFLRVYDETIAYAGLKESGKIESIAETEQQKQAPEEAMEQSANDAQRAPLTFMPPNMVESAREREWLRGPLSKATSYRLLVNGDLGPREIGKLIKLLEAQKAVLDDDEESET